MTLKEAIAEANNRSRNINLQWFVCKWNKGYCINSSNHMKRFPNTKYVFCTGDTNRIWRVFYDEKEKKTKHIVEKI